MVIERRILVDLFDIKAITYECKTCGRRMTCIPEFCREMVPHACECGASWHPLLEGNPVDMNEDAFAKFLKGLQRIRKLERDGKLGMRILVEVDEPSESISRA